MLLPKDYDKKRRNQNSSTSQRDGANKDLRAKFRSRMQGEDAEEENGINEESQDQSSLYGGNIGAQSAYANGDNDNNGSDQKQSTAENDTENQGQEQEQTETDTSEEDFDGKDSVLDTIKFRVNAFKMMAFQKTDMKCPYCEKKSIYMEQIHEKLFRDIVWAWCGLTREPRYICVNKKCRAYFNKHKSRMKVGYSGRLQYTHFLGSFIDFNIFHIDR